MIETYGMAYTTRQFVMNMVQIAAPFKQIVLLRTNWKKDFFKMT